MQVRLRGLVLLLVACRAQVVELGTPDAASDAVKDDAPASTCVCRLTPCRLAVDCALTGGTCGGDFFCTGDFGRCTTAATCSVCTISATSTTACP